MTTHPLLSPRYGNVTLEQEQKAFDRVWNHYVLHRHAAGQHAGDVFVYNPDYPDRRSPVGLLIPTRDMQRRGGTVYAYSQYLGRLRRAGLRPTFVTALEEAHSHATESKLSFRKAIAANLTRIADRFGLTLPNRADLLPTIWSTERRAEQPAQLFQRLSDEVPEARRWLLGIQKVV